MVIESKARCAEQLAHTDWARERFRDGDWSDASGVPLEVILSIEPGGSLEVWPGSHIPQQCARKERLSLPTLGQVLIFRGDFVHAGSGYVLPHRRIHCFLDPIGVKRPSDETSLVGFSKEECELYGVPLVEKSW